MKIKVNMYVCSKPLQYFNVLNLPRDKAQKNILVIEDKFKDAYKFYESVKTYDDSWFEIYYKEDRSKILLLCLFKYRVINFYYYLDFMLRAALFLYAVPCKNIFIYEEGISAYRTDIFKNTAAYKRKIRRFIGLSEYAGFHSRVKGMYVYNKEKYLKTFSQLNKKKQPQPLPFNASFEQMLKNNIELSLKIFQFDAEHIFADVQNKKVLLYITSWPLNNKALENINTNEYDYCIIKPHPHIRDLELPAHWNNNKTIIIESVILAEFIIEVLIERNNRVDIYHHNSSAVMYLNQHSNINSVTRL